MRVFGASRVETTGFSATFELSPGHLQGPQVAPKAPMERIEPAMAKTAGTKSMTKSEIANQLAEKVGISKKQATQFLQAQAELAYKNAKNVFTIPGIGKLKLVDRPARMMTMQFGPDKGQQKMIPKSKKVRFSVSKMAKDAILGAK
jgi:DNA-binding protein HU-beta